MNIFGWLIASSLLDDEKKPERQMTAGEQEFWGVICYALLGMVICYTIVIVAAMAGWKP